MDSIVLDAPTGIDARLGWDPAVTAHDRKRVLARQLVGSRLGVEPDSVRVEREAPTSFGHHTRLIAWAQGDEVPLAITVAEYRSATVVAVSDPARRIGIDLRDLRPDPQERASIHAHSHLWTGSTELDFLQHWTRVQAVIAADGRVTRVWPEVVRLDPSGTRGWVPDRPVRYTLADLSHSTFLVTLAYADVPAG